MTKYIITKKECAKFCVGKVCPGCGKPIEPLETVDNAYNPTYWSGCSRCGRFTCGTTPLLFKTAKIMSEMKHHHFDVDIPKKERKYLLSNQLFDLSSIINDVLSAYERAKLLI